MQKLKFIELFISDVFGVLTKDIFYARQKERKNRMWLQRPHGMRQPQQHSMNAFSFEIKAGRKMHIYYSANH